MPWTFVMDDRGQGWNLNELGLWILTRQYVYNSLIRSRTRLERLGYWPERVQLNTDFRGIRQETERQAETLYTTLALQVQDDGTLARRNLIELREATDDNVRFVRRMQQGASYETFHNIERCVERAETGRQIAVQVRNYSVSTLLIGSTMISGGAGLAILGAGSALSGVANYEDNGNVGAAVLNATGTFVVGLIPFSAASLAPASRLTAMASNAAEINYAERAALVFAGATVNAGFTGAGALIEGRSASAALRAAGSRFALDVTAGAMGLGLDHLPFPVGLRLYTDQIVDAAARHSSAASASGGGSSSPGGRGVRGPGSSMRGASAPAAVRSGPRPQPRPTNPICDANATLNSGGCGAEAWVEQIVLRSEF